MGHLWGNQPVTHHNETLHAGKKGNGGEKWCQDSGGGRVSSALSDDEREGEGEAAGGPVTILPITSLLVNVTDNKAVTARVS